MFPRTIPEWDGRWDSHHCCRVMCGGCVTFSGAQIENQTTVPPWSSWSRQFPGLLAVVKSLFTEDVCDPESMHIAGWALRSSCNKSQTQHPPSSCTTCLLLGRLRASSPATVTVYISHISLGSHLWILDISGAVGQGSVLCIFWLW